MKDIKITKDNYQQLFECAGFKKKGLIAWEKEGDTKVDGELGLLKLTPTSIGKDFSIAAKFFHNFYSVRLGSEVTSTAEIDRLFYPFLDKPLVWQKKWDFDSVFYRTWGDAVQRDEFRSSYVNQNPRVQAFSRLLLVMNELNKEYNWVMDDYCHICIKHVKPKSDNNIVCRRCKWDETSEVFIFGTRTAGDLFLRDNKQDLKTFFNI